ncbi:MAG: large subunit ribosomal protein [Candidatus Parcubacteria bacterium]
MKVILLQDVAKIGRRFSIVSVPDGYALNQLIPKKLAEPATPINLKRIEKYQATVVAGKQADEGRFDAAVAALHENVPVVTVEANEQGHLFKAVHEDDIVTAAAVVGVSIDRSMVKISSPIKSVGDHTVELVGGSKKHPFIITVVKK